MSEQARSHSLPFPLSVDFAAKVLARERYKMEALAESTDNNVPLPPRNTEVLIAWVEEQQGKQAKADEDWAKLVLAQEIVEEQRRVLERKRILAESTDDLEEKKKLLIEALEIRDALERFEESGAVAELIKKYRP